MLPPHNCVAPISPKSAAGIQPPITSRSLMSQEKMRNNTKCHQTIGHRLLKYLTLFCAFKSVGAQPFPSPPAAELGAPSPACKCSDKLEGMEADTL